MSGQEVLERRALEPIETTDSERCAQGGLLGARPGLGWEAAHHRTSPHCAHLEHGPGGAEAGSTGGPKPEARGAHRAKPPEPQVTLLGAAGGRAENPEPIALLLHSKLTLRVAGCEEP